MKDLEGEVKEFFSFCGHITHFTLVDNEATLVFQHPEAARSAVLLTGTTIGDQKINVEAVPVVPESVQSSRISEPVSVTPEVKTQASIVDTLLAKGYVLADNARQQAQAYDEQYQVSATVQSLVQQLDEKTQEFEKEYKISEMSQNAFDSLGKKIQEVDKEYSIGATLSQAVAAAVNTGELARDVIVARTSETSAAVQTGTEDARNQGAVLAEAAGTVVENTLASAAQALDSLQLTQKGEAVVSSIQNFVETNETATATWASLQQWATSIHEHITGAPQDSAQ